MNRARAKATGLSLALLGGWASAAEPAGRTAAVGGSAAPPALLPAAMRVPEAPAPVPPAPLPVSPIGWSPDYQPRGLTDAVWLPARPPAPVAAATVAPPSGAPVAPVPPPVAPGPIPAADWSNMLPEVPDAAPTDDRPNAPVVGPRATGSAATAAPMPEVPPFPTFPTATAPPLPETMPGPKPVPSPTPDVPAPPLPQPMPRPTPPVPPVEPATPKAVERPTPLPAPRPTAPAPDVWGGPQPVVPQDAELQPAPPEVVHGPASTVPYRKGTFGSPPIRLSRDYPPLSDLVSFPHPFRDGRGGDAGFDTDGNAVAGGLAPLADRSFVQVEYLLWWLNRDRIPVLATTATGGGNGFLGAADTVSVIGPGRYGSSGRNGFRVRAGTWLDDCGTCGIDGSFFFLGQRSNATTLNPSQYPVITRPFFAVNGGGVEFGEIVNFPNFSRGTLQVHNDSFLWGADANFRKALYRNCGTRIEAFAGFRFLALDESLTITENIAALPGGPDIPGTQVMVQDRFAVHDRFYGGQIGALYNRQWGRFDLYARGSVALGDTHQEVDIDGYQLRTPPGGATERFTGGLLATPTNIGHFSRDRFSAVPELTLNLGYWITPGIKPYFGYNVLYWPNVVRPGQQIDRVVNVSDVPNMPGNVPFSNVPRPAPTFTTSDLLLQGVQFGVEFRW